jgi:hypothetical protein
MCFLKLFWGATVLPIIPGEGRFTWADGHKYTGGYKDGRPHGKGCLTKLDSPINEREETRLDVRVWEHEESLVGLASLNAKKRRSNRLSVITVLVVGLGSQYQIMRI